MGVGPGGFQMGVGARWGAMGVEPDEAGGGTTQE